MAERDLIIEDARIFTGTGQIIPSGHITVRKGRIEAVCAGPAPAESRTKAQLVNAEGRWVLPGLIDAHCHICEGPGLKRQRGDPVVPFMAAALGVANARTKLRTGVTTIRDVGAVDRQNLLLKRAITEGLTPGPRVLACGDYIAALGGHCEYWSWLVRNPQEAAVAAQAQLDAGADLIKLMVSGGISLPTENPKKLDMELEEITAAVAVAHRAKAKVAVHAHPAAAIRASLEAGCDTVEHGTYLEPDLVKLMLERDAALIPTMCVYDRMKRNVDGIDKDLVRMAQHTWEEKVPRLRAAFRAGVRIGVGTDSAIFFPHDDLHSELRLLVQVVGFTPEQALCAATRINAEILGIDDQVGTLEVGKSADVILVDGEPLRNIEDIQKVYRVVARGVVV